MKSAYELAMERLEKQSPSRSLDPAQKEEISAIDSKYRAKIAEKEVFLGDLIAKATSEGKPGEVAELEQQLANEIRRLQAECEEKKEAVRNRAGS